MKKVMIGTPTYDGKLTMNYTNALIQTMLLGLKNDIEFIPHFLGYEPIISRARNIVLHEFVKSPEEYDGILWIDADVQWEPQWAIDIIKSEKDVIGIPLVVKDLSREHYSLAVNPDNLVPDENGLLSVYTMGTGFLYNSRESVEKIYEPALPFFEQGVEIKWVFENVYTKEMLLGEDVIYCAKLRDAGYEVFIDTNKSCRHIGTATYYSDFSLYLKRLQEEAE
jgi:glycosyltransferase involved in cell wall biosynthesis